MIPQDGLGYGRSQYWEWKAKTLAFENDEACKHFFQQLPIVKFKYDASLKDSHMTFKVKCSSCKAKFPHTEFAIRRKFFEMYAMEVEKDKINL